MSYKDTEFTQVCPYNCFNECFYENCPFFIRTEETKKHFLGWSDDYHRHEEYRYETIIHLGCRKVEAEIRASHHEPDNIEVNVNNHTAVRSSIF